MVLISSTRENSYPTELILLGTGTSSSLPHLDCLTASQTLKPPCQTCLSTLTPQGKKNIRRNTSAAIRMRAADGRSVTIVIDAGKNFQAAALEWFPKYGLRRIDALLITHAHADAMNGLDDLRGWTLCGAIQPHIDVYASQDTYTEVQRSFPYLVSKEFASGGGDVPEFKWHIIYDKTPFEIGDTGIRITPFAVQHGRIFTAAPAVACIPTPASTVPSSPKIEEATLPIKQPQVANGVKMNRALDIIQPYMCFGFKIQDQIAYISDVSHIPEDAWSLLESLSVLILDCLRLRSHTSHFGLEDSLRAARRINASRTYWTGFGHEVSHDEYITLGEMVEGINKDFTRLTEMEKRGMELIEEGKKIWVRPGHDGLRVFVKDGLVRDESY
ncbi:hypothetical protein AMATHDRAFT_72527 [Amanita thiersii Skay4041]|uniref:Metallo-beta-lactamase domain-containing protein n=1 Tax=Amanita thiersii Skay4041 TaxID=703135 RepID=A0A2A9P1P5_9AGAR|nr:hypothetical protein AMATHDRAFT_72527 [Amanita thiersii Skay4041]